MYISLSPSPSPSQDNVGYFRTELKESSQVLADVLGSATSSAGTLTPQLMDDELPVLSSSTSKHSSVPSIRTVSSNSITPTQSFKTSSSSSVRTSILHSNSAPNHVHGTGNSIQSHSHVANPSAGHMRGAGTTVHSHSHSSVASLEEGMDLHRHHGNKQQMQQILRTTTGVKRRRWSVEQGPSIV